MVNFAILRVAKMNNFGSLSASGQHNFRERLTKNADAERTTLNEIEGAKSTLDLVKAVSDLLPTKRRKDAVICIEYMISASPEHFGEDWRDVKNHGADYFKDAIQWLEKRHGKGNVVCTTVHLDESTPHLAAYVVPRTADGRLSAKDFVGGRSALSKMQTSFAAEVGVKHGLVRGVERSNAVHQDNAKIAPMTAERLVLRKRVKALEDEVERLVKSAGAGGAALAAAQKALTQVQGELVNVQGALAMAMAQAKADSKAKAEIRAELAIATSELVKAEGEILRLRQSLDHGRKMNMQFLTDISNLETEKNKLIADRIVKPAAEVEVPPEASRTALEDFEAKWNGIQQVGISQASTGSLVDVCGNRAVYHLGRGNYGIRTFAPGEVVPQLRNATEQQKGGIAGR